MASTEKSTKAAGRCESHPRRQAEYECDSCGRPLCLTCAIPVRGQVMGPECVGAVAERDGEPRRHSDRSPALVAAGGGFLTALVGTVLPWSAPNYSHYTGMFGGWGFSPLAWSVVAAVGALTGLGLWGAVMLSPRVPAPWTWTLAMAAVLLVAGTILYLVWPPFATHPWLGPWVTLIGGALALGGSLRAVSEQREARIAPR